METETNTVKELMLILILTPLSQFWFFSQSLFSLNQRVMNTKPAGGNKRGNKQ